MAWIRISALVLGAFCAFAIRAEEKKVKPVEPRVYAKIEPGKKPASGKSYYVEFQPIGVKRTLIGKDAQGNSMFGKDSAGTHVARVLRDGDSYLIGGLSSILKGENEEIRSVFLTNSKLNH